jgi:hypothetical protein
MEVIERHPHRTVDIRGIDNHEITSIPVITAGAVARSQRGDVIVIMHHLKRVLHAFPVFTPKTARNLFTSGWVST